MKIDKLEEFWGLLDLKYPGLLPALRPRRIVCPAGYIDPKYYSLASAVSILGQYHNHPEMDNMRATMVAITNQLLLHNMPTYFVDEQFAAACAATDPPDDYPLKDIHFPMPAMVLAFPQSFVRSHIKLNAPFVSVARLEKGEHRKHPIMQKIGRVGCEGEMVGIGFPLILSTGNFIWYSGWFPTTHNVGVFKSEMNEFVDDEEVIKAFLRETHSPEERIERLMSKEETPKNETEDKHFIRDMEVLATKVIMCISAIPKYISEGTLERKPKIKNGILKKDGLWSPSFFGRGYQIKRGTTEGEGTHSSPRVHWRRGHWHHVVHGPKRSLRRLDWFEPVLVNAE